MSEIRSERMATVLSDGLAMTECLRWHDGRLFVSDMHGDRFVAIDGHGRTETVVEVDNIPAGLGWLPGGRLLVVTQDDRRVWRLKDGGLVLALWVVDIADGRSLENGRDIEDRFKARTDAVLDTMATVK